MRMRVGRCAPSRSSTRISRSEPVSKPSGMRAGHDSQASPRATRAASPAACSPSTANSLPAAIAFPLARNAETVHRRVVERRQRHRRDHVFGEHAPARVGERDAFGRQHVRRGADARDGFADADHAGSRVGNAFLFRAHAVGMAPCGPSCRRLFLLPEQQAHAFDRERGVDRLAEVVEGEQRGVGAASASISTAGARLGRGFVIDADRPAFWHRQHAAHGDVFERERMAQRISARSAWRPAGRRSRLHRQRIAFGQAPLDDGI